MTINYSEKAMHSAAIRNFGSNDRITIVPLHPHLSGALADMRDQNTADTSPFSDSLTLASFHAILAATATLATENRVIHTPLAKMDTMTVAKRTVFAPILRAAVGMHEAAHQLFPHSPTIWINMHRNETTAQPIWEKPLKKIEKFGDGANTHIFVLDPMLATGGSAIEAVNALQEMYRRAVVDMVSLIAAPAGIKVFLEHTSNSHLTVAAVDSHLNDNAYIVPGLGDAGDRQFGTT